MSEPEPEPGTSSGYPQIAAAAVAVGAFVVGLVGMRVADPAAEWPDSIYRSLQLFTFEGDALEGLAVNGWLQGARFLAPAGALFVVLATLRGLLSSRWRRSRIAANTGHAIVCGESDAALALARNLREAGRAVVLVGAADAESPGGGRIPAVPGDPREPATLRAAGIAGATALYACAPRSAVNAAIALSAARSRVGSPTRVATYAQVRSDDLVEALRVRRLAATGRDTVTMDFFALDDIAARLLVARHPPGSEVVVIVGFGDLGQAVLRAILRGPATGEVVVVTAAGAEEVAAEAGRLEARQGGRSVRRAAQDPGSGTAYVCLADEDEAVATGLRLGRAGDRDVVVCLQRESPFAEALDVEARLQFFGVLDRACQEQAIAWESIVGRAARAVHERYRADCAARGDTVGTNPSMVEWRDLPPHLQQSNIAQAEGIGAKLGEIGARLSTRPPAVPFAFADGEVEKLARVEHARWKKEREDAGYEWGPSRSGNRHPDLVDWPNLPADSRRKDVDAVEHLPVLLATEGLHIRRDAAG